MKLKEAISKSLPKQHGTWFIFVTAYIMAHFVYEPVFSNSCCLFLSMSLLIFAQSGVVFWVKTLRTRRRQDAFLVVASIYFVLASLPAFFLIFVKGYELLLLFGLIVGFLALVSLYLVYTGRELSVEAEVLNITTLSLVVLAVGYIAEGRVTWNMVALWITTSLFYLGSIFRVRYLIRDRKLLSSDLKTRFRTNSKSILYHTVSYLVVLVFVYGGLLPPLMVFAFLPTFLRAVYIVVRRYEKPPAVAKIGWSEVLNSVIFVVLTIISFRFGS